jgi:hypothetical protein
VNGSCCNCILAVPGASIKDHIEEVAISGKEFIGIDFGVDSKSVLCC